MSEPAGSYGPSGVRRLRATKVRRMTRARFDRLAGEFAWPRGDYDARRGLAEVVAEPLMAHEGRAERALLLLRDLFGDRMESAGALRIEWRGSVLEPDKAFYFDLPPDGPGFPWEAPCRPELGHLPPPLVVEIDRSAHPARAAEKRGDYFEMGVREVWVWTPNRGAALYCPGADGGIESVSASGVVPGLTRGDLEELWGGGKWGEGAKRRVRVARRIRAATARPTGTAGSRRS